MPKKFYYVWERPVMQVYAFDSVKKLTTADQVIAEAQRLEEDGRLDPEVDNDCGEGRCSCDGDTLS
jgi:hypothetical protein